MTTKELIEKLQELDPSGERKVAYSDDQILNDLCPQFAVADYYDHKDLPNIEEGSRFIRL